MGKAHWTEKKLLLKRLRIAQVFNAIRAEREYGKYPDIVAFAETENRQVFAGTLAALDRATYAIDYHESPDPRGIDIGLAWNPATVKFTGSKPYKVRLNNRRGTRFVIAAGFTAASNHFTIVLNHWPSRSFDTQWSETNRIAAARVARHIVDSLRTCNPQSEIIVMGDFNDQPENHSVKDVLGSSLTEKRFDMPAADFFTTAGTRRHLPAVTFTGIIGNRSTRCWFQPHCSTRRDSRSTKRASGFSPFRRCSTGSEKGSIPPTNKASSKAATPTTCRYC